MDAKNGSGDDNYQCMFGDEFRNLAAVGFNNVVSSVLAADAKDPPLPC
jgi:hypothetical protein